MKQYEQQKFDQWLELATPIVATTFKTNILKISTIKELYEFNSK